jgi:hypothetical protein
MFQAWNTLLGYEPERMENMVLSKNNMLSIAIRLQEVDSLLFGSEPHLLKPDMYDRYSMLPEGVGAFINAREALVNAYKTGSINMSAHERPLEYFFKTSIPMLPMLKEPPFQYSEMAVPQYRVLRTAATSNQIDELWNSPDVFYPILPVVIASLLHALSNEGILKLREFYEAHKKQKENPVQTFQKLFDLYETYKVFPNHANDITH